MEPVSSVTLIYDFTDSREREMVSMEPDPFCHDFFEDRGLGIGPLLRIGIVVHVKEPFWVDRIINLMMADITGKGDFFPSLLDT